MANKRSHTGKTVNWWHEGGDCCSAQYSFSSYTEGQILPPLQLLLLHRMSTPFGWRASAEPLNRACSGQGWIAAQIGCRMSPIPFYGPFMCGIISQIRAWHLHPHLPRHPWMLRLLSRVQCPCMPLCCCLAGENQSVPLNLAFCMQIIDYLVSGVLQRRLTSGRRKQLVFNVDLYLCTERGMLVK